MRIPLTSNRFDTLLAAHGMPSLERRLPTTLQVNLGKVCNQACRHCHVDASPTRTESMDARTVAQVLSVLATSPSIQTVDLTGGAPELNPHFRRLVDAARASGADVTVRCNLTVLAEPGQEDLAEFYASRRVTVIASLPCYTPGNTDAQRGAGAFGRSIAALLTLNGAGYGEHEGAEVPEQQRALRLHLVYNPSGPCLPPPQTALEADYRRHLTDDFAVRFDHLLAITNMPIHRFAEDLDRNGNLDSYRALLSDAFEPAAVAAVMCRDLVNVDWDGALADCDFNQMLGMELGAGRRTIFDVQDLGGLQGQAISTGDHCLGCTAGQGSSCGGAISNGLATT